MAYARSNPRPGSKRRGVKQVHDQHTCQRCLKPGHNIRTCNELYDVMGDPIDRNVTYGSDPEFWFTRIIATR